MLSGTLNVRHYLFAEQSNLLVHLNCGPDGSLMRNVRGQPCNMR